MKQNCKEKLIQTTIHLINKYDGDVTKVTVREITSDSGVSVGLLHYHFKDKENLINLCVQKIIAEVVHSFHPEMNQFNHLPCYEAGKERLKYAAKQVFYFLFKNPSICKISIINDYAFYTKNTNSSSSIQGFSSIIGDAIQDEMKKERIAFYVTNSMQVAFLKAQTDPIYLGYNFQDGVDRARFIDDLIDTMM